MYYVFTFYFCVVIFLHVFPFKHASQPKVQTEKVSRPNIFIYMLSFKYICTHTEYQ